MAKGWVYVTSNEALPGLLKVGFSSKDPKVRAVELDLAGLPHPHVVEYEVLVEDPQSIEKRTHELLAAHHHRKEFFRCDLAVAVKTIREVVGGGVILEELRKPLGPALEDLNPARDAHDNRWISLGPYKGGYVGERTWVRRWEDGPDRFGLRNGKQRIMRVTYDHTGDRTQWEHLDAYGRDERKEHGGDTGSFDGKLSLYDVLRRLNEQGYPLGFEIDDYFKLMARRGWR